MEKLCNNKFTNWLNIAVLFLLTLNYMLYSFFDFGHFRNYIRLAMAAILFVILVLQFLGNCLQKRHVVLLLLAGYQLLTGGTNSLNIAFLILVTLTMASGDNKKVFTQAFWIMVIFSLLVALSLCLGIQKNFHYVSDVDSTRERNTLGFINVNGASIFAFSLIASYLLSRKKAKLWHVGIALAVAVVIYYFTDSRTPFLGIIITIVLWLLMPILPKKWIKYCLWAGFGLLFASPAIWSLPFVNSPAGNQLLSLRPKLFAVFIEQQSIITLLFGGNRVAEIDNGYLLLLYNCGVIVYIAIALAIVKACEKLLADDKHMELAYVVSMFICAVFEGTVLRPELLCAPLLWKIVFDNVSWGTEESLLINKTRNLLGRFLPILQNAPEQ